MTIGLTEDARDLRDSVRGWAARHVGPDVVRAAVNAKADEKPPYWLDLAAQGLLGLYVPEELGGAGAGLLELAVVVEELGRALVPGPYLPTVLAGAILREAGHTALLPGIAEGSVIAAVGLQPGSLRLDGDGALSGEPEPVLGGQLADIFVLPARSGDGIAWVMLERARLQVTAVLSHDPTRRCALVRADTTVTGTEVLTFADDHRPLDLAATLVAAEASGLADWAVGTAADYAKVRQQFGRQIGQFQGVKHRVARMLTRAEQARACAWDAARALNVDAEVSAREAALSAAVAGAVAPEAAFAVAKDCIQTLGGIGFTWEHDANLVLRRTQSLRILLGATAHWQQRVASLTLGGVRRQLGIDLPPEAEQTRAAVRAELAEIASAVPGEPKRLLAERGYTSPHLPTPWGRSADAVAQLVIAEELATAELEPHDMIIGNWVVPTLIAHGSDAQMQEFCPPSLRGDIVWCQLFSEPGAGSDLAGLSTKATKVDGGWLLNGQKVWTSGAQDAHWGICLARTDPTVAKNKGISYFLVDMSTPGIDIRPLRELTGECLFNEVFLDNVFVPGDKLVGRPGEGWKLALTTLANERVSMSQGSSLGGGGETLLSIAAEDGRQLDDQELTTLGGVLCDAQSLGLLGLRATIRSLSGQQPGAESSIAKLLGVEHIQQMWEFAMSLLGSAALVGEQERQGPVWMFLNTRALTIAGGTTDVQLNIIGERLLGLPRDPQPGK